MQNITNAHLQYVCFCAGARSCPFNPSYWEVRVLIWFKKGGPGTLGFVRTGMLLSMEYDTTNHSEQQYHINTMDNNIEEIQWTLMSSKLRVYLFWYLTWEAFPRYKATFQKYRITSIFPMEGINSNKQTKLCLEKRTSKNPSYVLFWISKCIEKIKCIIVN